VTQEQPEICDQRLTGQSYDDLISNHPAFVTHTSICSHLKRTALGYQFLHGFSVGFPVALTTLHPERWKEFVVWNVGVLLYEVITRHKLFIAQFRFPFSQLAAVQVILGTPSESVIAQ
jgi:hypothetical protein